MKKRYRDRSVVDIQFLLLSFNGSFTLLLLDTLLLGDVSTFLLLKQLLLFIELSVDCSKLLFLVSNLCSS